MTSPRDASDPLAGSDSADDPGAAEKDAPAPSFAESVLLHDSDDDSEEPTSTLTVSVDLPAEVRTIPEDELAVTISAEPVTPNILTGVEAANVSISVDPVLIDRSDEEESPVDAVEVPPLPARDIPEQDAQAHERQSRRERLRGEISSTPESANMLTADRLIDVKKRKRAAPEGAWPAFVYAASLHLVNLGDSPKARERKELDARIDKQFEGGTRFVPVLTRKGGVGKTTVTTLLGMALSDVREDRIIAIDANPDRGTLSERVSKQTRSTVRDVVTQAASITSFNDFSTMVSRDDTRLDILASDTDPLLSEAFDENDYNVVADLAARFYSIALTDCGTGIVHSVMRATLQRADSIVIVSGGSVDEARLASETLTWLESNGYADLVRNAVVALNTATQATNLIKLDEIESHFQSRVREIVRIPYDPQLAAGSVIDYSRLKPLTREAARRLAALVMDGLPARRTE
ncbi:MinD/ParA family protein [Salinibacterium sp. SYSU T00001]|uniref:MinD/ParA family ATP-binding protein n=1 Tax=Homoserinimonas sedimenticola TaxID=2986805 RepID=UPI002236439D|nr:MinD/ParA family protein [Salinibacterium sedimenticola]MCW4384259.1 MinD/ParA family protein [Salinibacterium sedimenticola]